MQSTLSFHGAAGAVTGSNFLLDTGGAKFLVDCGLMQGLDVAHNWEPFPYDPKEISALMVTHAHLDHIGRIPKLVKEGFRGKIISTKATRALVEPLLKDALELIARSAEHRGRPPLYGEKDLSETMRLWQGVGYHEQIPLGDNVTLELFDAGHILGSAMVKLSRAEQSVMFTGDLGGGNSPLLPPTEDIQATYLVMESTYGDRARPDDSHRLEELENAIEDAAARGGTLLIPAFSTERTQDLLFDIRRLMEEKRVPDLPVYLDSPLAEKITSAYLAHPDYFSDEIRKRIEGGEKIFSFENLHYTEGSEDSEKLNSDTRQKIILAGSGMSSGGRVLSHERAYLPDPKSTLLIVGYQAVGTIGRQILEGAPSIKLRSSGEVIPVRAKIVALFGYSAHCDGEGLLEFANKAHQSGTKEVFLVHGEPAASMFLAQRIRDYLGLKSVVPEAGEKFSLDF